MLWLTVGLAVLSALWLAALQYRSLDVIVKNQEEHRRSALEGALGQSTKALDFEVSRAFTAFHFGSAGEQQTTTVLEEWNRLAPYPKIVKGVYWVEGLNAQPFLKPVGRSTVPHTAAQESLMQIDQLLRTRSTSGAPSEIFEHPLGFLISAPPAIPPPLPSIVPGAQRALGLRPLSRGLFVFLDQDYLVHDLLPLLLRDESGYSESDYELAVFRISDGNSLIGKEATSSAFSSSLTLFRVGLSCVPPPVPGSAGGLNMLGPSDSTDILVPLRALLAAKAADCPTPAITPESGQGAWSLAATPRAALSLRAFERRSLLVTSAAAASLAGSLVMLLVLIMRTHHLAKLQMEFVAGVSHELRTPLGTIGIAADNLSSGLVQTREDAVQYGKVIQTESRRLSHLVEQVLTYGRAVSMRWEPTRGSLTVDQILDLALSNSGSALQAAGLSVQLSIAPNLPPVNGELEALARCIQNLLDNCAKYACDGGVVIVRADAGTGGKGPEVCLSVEDRGPGLNPRERKCIFEPFIRGNHAGDNGVPGFGLGLNIAKRIVEAHHGTIEVFQPAGDRGAGFLIRLPAGSTPDSEGGG